MSNCFFNPASFPFSSSIEFGNDTNSQFLSAKNEINMASPAEVSDRAMLPCDDTAATDETIEDRVLEREDAMVLQTAAATWVGI